MATLVERGWRCTPAHIVFHQDVLRSDIFKHLNIFLVCPPQSILPGSKVRIAHGGSMRGSHLSCPPRYRQPFGRVRAFSILCPISSQLWRNGLQFRICASVESSRKHASSDHRDQDIWGPHPLTLRVLGGFKGPRDLRRIRDGRPPFRSHRSGGASSVSKCSPPPNRNPSRHPWPHHHASVSANASAIYYGEAFLGEGHFLYLTSSFPEICPGASARIQFGHPSKEAGNYFAASEGASLAFPSVIPSGAVVPPEMIIVIAWSMVMPVGTSLLAATICR